MGLLGLSTRFTQVVGLSLLAAFHGAIAAPSTLSSRAASTVTVPPVNNFVLNGLAGQGPTTRNFDFVVTETDGAPDGFDRPMLVVNGEEPFLHLAQRTANSLKVCFLGRPSKRTSTTPWS